MKEGAIIFSAAAVLFAAVTVAAHVAGHGHGMADALANTSARFACVACVAGIASLARRMFK